MAVLCSWGSPGLRGVLGGSQERAHASPEVPGELQGRAGDDIRGLFLKSRETNPTKIVLSVVANLRLFSPFTIST